MTDSNSIIDRFESECIHFNIIKETAYLYTFNESSKSIELKGFFRLIFAKIAAFFSSSYRFNQHISLKNKIITSYTPNSSNTNSLTLENVSSTHTTGRLKKITSKFKEVTNTLKGDKKTAEKFKEIVTALKRNSQNTEENSATDAFNKILQKHFPNETLPSLKISPRDYTHTLSEQEKGDIAFTFTKLATENLFNLASLENDLKAAGRRVKHVHPLLFFAHVFTDQTLTGHVITLKTATMRQPVWSQFIAKMKVTFDEEFNHNNITSLQLQEFAKKTGSNHTALMTHSKAQDWDAFISSVIESKKQ